jgi:hypothetical protein
MGVVGNCGGVCGFGSTRVPLPTISLRVTLVAFMSAVTFRATSKTSF